MEDFDSDFGDFHGKIYISKFDGKKNGFGWVLDGTVEDFDSDLDGKILDQTLMKRRMVLAGFWMEQWRQ